MDQPNSSPDLHNSPPDQDMEDADVQSPSATSKRYRPAPAKTFQCRGYGECRMVFSRSEHLARHIRKHTGERPFSCHCSKQFSRLDNLRQHAQTVHADKQDENERMMRDLTSLHATMSAANKLGGGRGSRRGGGAGTSASNASSAANGGSTAGAPLTLIKQEDLPMHQRPGTSTGYEGGDMYYNSGSRNASNSSFRDSDHSFREPGQSFLAPSSSSAAAAAAPGQSFLGFSGLSDASRFDGTRRPGTGSRPTTSSGAADAQHPRSLPPLAAVVSASLPSPPLPPPAHPSSSQQHQQQQQQQQHQSSQHILPFPSAFSIHRRPSTANRPGTAPAAASLFSSRASFPDRSGMGSSSGRPDLSLLHSGFGTGRTSSSGFSQQHLQQYELGDSGEISTSPGNDPSPFFFNPPTATTSPPSVNPRKRAFAGPDGPLDDASAVRSERPSSSAGPFGDYEYGSESRPQSRRLSVMELCNDDDEQPRPPSQRHQYASGSAAFLLSSTAATANVSHGSSSRPVTSSGLVSSTSTLRLFDRTTPPSTTPVVQQSSSVFSRISYASGGADGARTSTGGGGGSGASEFGRGGGGVSSAPFTRIPSSNSALPASPGASSASPSPATPTFPPPGVLSTSSSASSTYPTPASSFATRGAYHYPQQQQYEQQYGYSQHHAQQQQHATQYQLAHSPTFSTASGVSNASYSPRSPVSDGSGSTSSGSPFTSYARPRTRSPAVYAPDGGHAAAHAGSGVSTQSHHHYQQRDGQVRTSLSPHSPGFGMRA